MARTAWSAAVFAALFVILWGCAGPDHAARKSRFEGRLFLERGDYGPARQDFVKAAQVERVLTTGQVDLVRLERLLDGDVRRYESDIAQWYGEGTGYFAERYGRPFVNMVPSR